MKKMILSLVLLFLMNMNAQSFEEMIFSDITTTISSSRSANFIDVNGDGWDDIFFTNGLNTGERNMLYINNGNGTFTTITNDDIVQHSIRAVGATFADADNDGDLDGCVVTWGFGGQPSRNYFYRNNGNGTFTFEADMITNRTYSETSNWIDANNDQWLDLYITNSAQSLRNLYFENQGDGTFLQVNNLVITNESKPSRSVDWVDYDNDGDSDIFVTNEGNNKNTLYRNDGLRNFTQITDLAIVQDFKNSMGSSWADVDNDGDFDLVVTNSDQPNQLFMNQDGIFTEVTDSAIAAETTNSFGSSFGDLDNDGDLDLLIANAYSDTHFTNSLFINDGIGNFTKNTSSVLVNHQGWTYGVAFGDYNNDGWLDAIFANNQNEAQANSVFKNTGSGKNWVKIKCMGTVSNKSAIGTIVKITATINGNAVTQTRKIEAASGYAGQNSLTAHFGLNDAVELQQVLIKWPSGLAETFSGLDINLTHHLAEGSGTLAVNETTGSGFKLYPNPVEDTLWIESSQDHDAVFVLLNSEGKKIKEMRLEKESSIDVSKFPAGIYWYQILEDKIIKGSGKIIIK